MPNDLASLMQQALGALIGYQTLPPPEQLAQQLALRRISVKEATKALSDLKPAALAQLCEQAPDGQQALLLAWAASHSQEDSWKEAGEAYCGRIRGSSPGGGRLRPLQAYTAACRAGFAAFAALAAPSPCWAAGTSAAAVELEPL